MEVVLLGEGFRDAKSTRIKYATSSRHLRTELILIKRRKLKNFQLTASLIILYFSRNFFCLRGEAEEEEYNQSSFTFSNFFFSPLILVN